MELRYEAQVIDKDTDKVLSRISAPTLEMLEENLYKFEAERFMDEVEDQQFRMGEVGGMKIA